MVAFSQAVNAVCTLRFFFISFNFHSCLDMFRVWHVFPIRLLLLFVFENSMASGWHGLSVNVIAGELSRIDQIDLLINLKYRYVVGEREQFVL